MIIKPSNYGSGYTEEDGVILYHPSFIRKKSSKEYSGFIDTCSDCGFCHKNDEELAQSHWEEVHLEAYLKAEIVLKKFLPEKVYSSWIPLRYHKVYETYYRRVKFKANNNWWSIVYVVSEYMFFCSSALVELYYSKESKIRRPQGDMEELMGGRAFNHICTSTDERWSCDDNYGVYNIIPPAEEVLTLYLAVKNYPEEMALMETGVTFNSKGWSWNN